MSKKAWIIFVVVVVGLLTALVIFSHNSNPQIDVSKVDAAQPIAANKQNGNVADHSLGLSTSKVTLIEYGDFECPYCGTAYPQVKSVTSDYAGQINFIFRNFPLSTIHPNAMAAAGVAEAAGLQGKYWEMHDLLYTNQNSWVSLTGTARDDMFVSYAKQLGLDTTKFSNDLSSTSVLDKIAYDQALGKKIGVNSTPTFILDGQQVSSAVEQSIVNGDGSALKTALNVELKKYNITPPSS